MKGQKKGKGEVPVLNYTARQRYMGEWRITPRILKLSIRWGEWSVSCPSHFSPGEEPLVPTG